MFRLGIGGMRRKRVHSIFRKKPLKASLEQLGEGQQALKRHLKASHLVLIGIGAIIGAGIFVITGQVAALYTGPGIVLSFILAAMICTLAGLCYAELSALIPASGGSYSYAYIALGEFPAWIVGWSVCAQALISAALIGVGWSGYFVSLLKSFGLSLHHSFTQAPLSYDSSLGWHATEAIVNLPAVLLVLLLGWLISRGIKAAAQFNHVMVFVKLGTILLFIIMGTAFVHVENWIPLIPENQGTFGHFGWSGVLRGAGVVFFAYVGFDTVSTLAQDSIQPQKSIPRGILGSLFICTLTYIALCLVLVGIVPYAQLNVPDPMSIALAAMGARFFWFKFIVSLAILAGLTTVALVQMLGLSRMLLAMSKDGLLPVVFGKINPKAATPVASVWITTVVIAVVSGVCSVEILAQLVSMTTLFIFAIVCIGVWVLRSLYPNEPRAFKVPFVPWIPLLGVLSCIAQMAMLPFGTWLQLLMWLSLGAWVYFLYGRKYSVEKNREL